MASVSFAHSLEQGLIGESEIAQWLIRRGATILPAYEIQIERGKGPRIFQATGQLVAPDMLVVGKRIVWVEAKTKSGWSWHANSQKWQDGIDLNHWRDYQKVDATLPWPVWVLFLHRTQEEATPSREEYRAPPYETPPEPGIYGSTVRYLSQANGRESDVYGPHGMIYWNRDDLLQLAGYPL